MRQFRVIHAGATHGFFTEIEPQRLDEMQARTGIGAHADDIAGVRRNLGLVKDDMEHEKGLRATQDAICISGDHYASAKLLIFPTRSSRCT